ncbi:MAG TPA: MFS transporter [Lapillicoccus sp.]|nr:MFS transporter [Lapillicoccus sp.]
MTTAQTPDLVAAQRHTVRTLVATQAIGGIGLSAAIAVGALLAREITGSDGLAGLAQTAQTLGAALVAAGLAAYMSRHGRRPGLTLGYLGGAVGGALCLVSGVVGWFPLLLLGMVMLGAVTATNLQSRYAATDLAVPAHRGRDLSTVVWATTIGAVLGPNLSGPGAVLAGWLHIPEKTGPFIFTIVALLAAAGVMVTRLRPDPLLLARSVGAHDDPEPEAESVAHDRPWPIILHTPLVLAAAVGMALSHAVMVSVMVMTPIHMDHGGASLEIIGLVISGHILGMFAFSPLVGILADRVGSPLVIGIGGLVLLSSLVLSGLSAPGASPGLGAGLFLLGLGWSFGSVGSSTLLVAATPMRHRPRVQGTVDMITGFTAAAGGAVAGLVVATVGFGWLSAGAAVLAFGVVVVGVVAGRYAAPRRPVEPVVETL